MERPAQNYLDYGMRAAVGFVTFAALAGTWMFAREASGYVLLIAFAVNGVLLITNGNGEKAGGSIPDRHRSRHSNRGHQGGAMIKRTALAAVAVLALAGCTVQFNTPMIPGQPTPGILPGNDHAPSQAQPEPAPAEETKAAPEPTQEPRKTTRPKAQPKLSDTAHFRHFNVRVVGSTGRPTEFNAQVETCLVDEVKDAPTRIAIDPWTAISSSGKVTTATRDYEAGEAGVFPKAAKYREGECAFGWMKFHTNGMNVTKIKYSNSLGDVAVWDLDGKRLR
jgi:hypothetical protein